MNPRPDPDLLARSEPDEAQLLDAARGGDRDAFDRLAVRLLPRLLGTARRLLGEPVEAEEVVAATLVRVLASLKGFRGAASLSTWAHRILCRLAADRLRRLARTRRRERAFRADEDCAAAALEPAGRVSEREERQRLRRAVSRLPETQRMAVVLVVWEGLSLPEAAEVLGLRYATLKSNLHHARASLRSMLGVMKEPR